FIPIEALFPQKARQKTLHVEWKTDFTYFTISHLFVQVFGIIAQAPATILFGGLGLQDFQAKVQALPFIAQLFLALFCTDVTQYCANGLLTKRNDYGCFIRFIIRQWRWIGWPDHARIL